LLILAALLFGITEVLFRFGSDPSKAITSLMNVALIVVPLISGVLGTIHMYNSREFCELLLAQPLDRTSIYIGKLTGFTGALSVAFLVGTGVPFLIHGYQLGAYAAKIVALLSVGVALIVAFAALAFLAATRFEDRIKGLGSVILVWFVLAVLYDGFVLLFAHLLRDYPYEPGMVAMMFLNPIDLGRIVILLQLDISALMGYTGAVFRKVFGTGIGMSVSAAAMVVYAVVPVWLGLRAFRRKDF
jgi:Cu-processing system permease protein